MTQVEQDPTKTATFVFTEEDHTLGNALRFCLAKNPDVIMAGYDVPHPAEEKMQVRVQTNGKNPKEVVIEAAQAMGAIYDTYLQQLTQQIGDE